MSLHLPPKQSSFKVKNLNSWSSVPRRDPSIRRQAIILKWLIFLKHLLRADTHTTFINEALPSLVFFLPLNLQNLLLPFQLCTVSFAWNVLLSLAPSWHWGLQLKCHLLKEAFWLPCSSSLLPYNRPSPKQWLKTVLIIYLAQISERMGAEQGISLGLSGGCCPMGISKPSSSYTWCLGWEGSDSWELAQLTAQACLCVVPLSGLAMWWPHGNLISYIQLKTRRVRVPRKTSRSCMVYHSIASYYSRKSQGHLHARGRDLESTS